MSNQGRHAGSKACRSFTAINVKSSLGGASAPRSRPGQSPRESSVPALAPAVRRSHSRRVSAVGMSNAIRASPVRSASSRSEKRADGDVFVHVVPLISHTAADMAIVGALLGRGAKKSWKPRQRRRNVPAIHKGYDQLVIRALNIDSVRNGFTGQ